MLGIILLLLLRWWGECAMASRGLSDDEVVSLDEFRSVYSGY